MAIQVRTIDTSELAEWVACMDVGFLRVRSELEAFADYYSSQVDLERTWGALDERSERVVGTLRSFAADLTVPGPGGVRASALTNVTVAPTHRRRGLLTRMITGDLTASVERGDPVAILIASEYPIYGRFGFGPAVDGARYEVDTLRARFVTSGGGGSVELVDLAELRKEAPALYERYRRCQPGAITRGDAWWDRRLHQLDIPGEDPPKLFCALYRSPAGEAEGYVMYHAVPKWHEMRPEGVLGVEEMLSVTGEAYGALMRYCCDVDLVSKVEMSDRSVDEPLQWLLADGRSVRQSARYDFVWVRILDVCSSLSARRYLVDGRLVMEVSDPLGFGQGRFVLEGGPEGASCTATSTEPAQLSLPVDVLGSIYLGGVSLKTLSVGDRVDELIPGAIERADAMFRSTVTPWCSTWF